VRAVVLSIGAELVQGLRLDTHSADISRALTALGIEVLRHVTVGDDVGAILAALRLAAADADLIVATGGLGPTLDDCTRDALAEAMGQPLEPHAGATAHLEGWARSRGKTISPSNRVQTLLPHGARMLPNPVGTAVGIEAYLGRTRVFCMPGVPVEMRTMLDAEVLPRLREAQGDRVTMIRTVRTFGMPESILGERLADLMAPGRHPHVGTAVHGGMIDVHIYASGPPAEAEALLAADAEAVRTRLGAVVYGEGDATLAESVAVLLRKARATLAVAESCTGGLVAAKLVGVPGISEHFVEGIVAYANEAKVRDLAVDEGLIRARGAVSEPVAVAMAEGIRRRTGADVALGITGIAGPAGGTPEKPVGTVWMALADARGNEAMREIFTGDRALVRERAANHALNMVRLRLRETGGATGD